MRSWIPLGKQQYPATKFHSNYCLLIPGLSEILSGYLDRFVLVPGTGWKTVPGPPIRLEIAFEAPRAATWVCLDRTLDIVLSAHPVAGLLHPLLPLTAQILHYTCSAAAISAMVPVCSWDNPLLVCPRCSPYESVPLHRSKGRINLHPEQGVCILLSRYPDRHNFLP